MADKKTIAPVTVEEEVGKDVLAPEGAEPPALASHPLVMGESSGEIGASDIKFPSLRIIQKMSENPDKLDEGLITL